MLRSSVESDFIQALLNAVRRHGCADREPVITKNRTGRAGGRGDSYSSGLAAEDRAVIFKTVRQGVGERLGHQDDDLHGPWSNALSGAVGALASVAAVTPMASRSSRGPDRPAKHGRTPCSWLVVGQQVWVPCFMRLLAMVASQDSYSRLIPGRFWLVLGADRTPPGESNSDMRAARSFRDRHRAQTRGVSGRSRRTFNPYLAHRPRRLGRAVGTREQDRARGARHGPEI